MSVGEVSIVAQQVHGLHLRRPDFDRWYPASEAEFDEPLVCQARDGLGPYTLPMLCILTESGWINARTRTPLHVQVIGWKYR